ncbi:MAG: NifU family protein [Alphaproteobacteria bacterium]|nr:NifU family protein [Alphaproteobacteria bacterium]
MIFDLEEIGGNPNPKAMTFRIVRTDLIPGFSKLVFTKTGTLKAYSPLATHLLNKGDAAKVDMFFKDGSTFITITRKVMDWDPRSKIIICNSIRAFLITSGETPVFVDQIKSNVETMPSFTPRNSVESWVSQQFHEAITPLLASHGGAMELLNITTRDNKEVSLEVVMIGSCNECTTGKGTTLQGAQEFLELALEEFKLRSDDNKNPINHISLKGITPREVSDIAFRRS